MASISYNNIPHDPREVEDHQRNFTLGAFMTAWSQVESLCGFIFGKLSNVPADVAWIITDTIAMKDKIEIITALADQDIYSDLRREMERVAELSLSRNRIVHAGWGFYGGEPARFYHGITSAEFNEVHLETEKGNRIRARNIHTLDDLQAKTTDCQILVAKLQDIYERLPGTRPTPSAPVSDLARSQEATVRQHRE